MVVWVGLVLERGELGANVVLGAEKSQCDASFGKPKIVHRHLDVFSGTGQNPSCSPMLAHLGSKMRVLNSMRSSVLKNFGF